MVYEREILSIIFGASLATILIAFLFLFVLFLVAIYVYNSMAWSIIAKKLKYKNPWIAWIPIANWAMRLQLGGFHWAFIFLILIPFFGWATLLILIIISTWKIFEKRKYPGWLSLSMIIPSVGWLLYMIVIGFVAWKNKRR